ncbi:DUF4087 domain-containing protein [Pseudomonas sp. CGJS7]|uniref:DUF4087 domain-containing protein n=1 Tax=Pseudomonas sp. CGJS7 TaxID=3109348 RepID=UPI00300A074D
MPTLDRFKPVATPARPRWLFAAAMLLTAIAPAIGVAATDAAKKSAAPAAAAKNAIENRCGWYVNPSPANAWLIDRDGEWTISVQGGHQANGNWPPPIAEKQWVRYGQSSSYGHGCACMKVTTDRESMQIQRIVSSSGKPLSQCRRDRALVEPPH